MNNNYNVIDTVLSDLQQRDFKNSKIHQTLVQNNIDTAPLYGEVVDDGSGVIDTNISKEDIQQFSKEAWDFAKSIPTDIVIGMGIAGTNAFEKGMQFGRLILDSAGVDYNKQSYEEIVNNVEGFKNNLRNYQEDHPWITKLLGFAAQESTGIIPVYKKLKSIGVPSKPALLLSWTIGSSLVLGKEDQLFINSDLSKYFKKVLNVEDNTSAEDVYNFGWQAMENTAFGHAFDKIIQAIKYGKKIIGSTAVGTTIPNEVNPTTNEINPEINPNIPDAKQNLLNQNMNLPPDNQVAFNPNVMSDANMNSEKKSLDQSLNNLPPDNQYASTAVFKSMLKLGAEKLAAKGTGQQFLGQLRNMPGVKDAELKWTGLDDYLKSNKQVTKEEIQSFLKENEIHVSEVKFPNDKQMGKKPYNYENESELADALGLSEDEAANAFRAVTNYDEALLNLNNTRYDTFSISYGRYDKQGKLLDQIYNHDTYGYSRLENSFNSYDFYFQLEKYPYGADAFVNDYKKGMYQIINDDWDVKFLDKANEFYQTIHQRDFIDELYLTKDEFKKFKDLAKEHGNVNYDYEVTKMKKEDLKNFFWEARARFEGEEFANHTGVGIDTAIGSSGTKFGNYTLPGGKDYTEIVFKLNKDIPVTQNRPLPENVTLKGATDFTSKYDNINPSPHFNVPNEIAHVRFKTRDFDGKKVLAVDEMQSDLLQQVKRFNKEINREIGVNYDGKITDFPFKNNWYDLILKRLVRYGADNGFDAIAVPTGKIAQRRYGQEGGFVHHIRLTNVPYKAGQTTMTKSGTTLFSKDTNYISLDLFDKNNVKLKSTDGMRQEDVLKILDDYKIKAEDLDTVNEILNLGKSEGKMFEVGNKKTYVGTGKGKIELYDQAIPSVMKKYANKFNSKFYKTNQITSEGTHLGDADFYVLELNNDLKKTAIEDGQALFSLFGIGAGSTATYKSIQDNQGNNNISNSTNN